jgi:hypothetical protein
MGIQGYFLELNGPGREGGHSLPSIAEVTNSGAIPLLPSMFSGRGV